MDKQKEIREGIRKIALFCEGEPDVCAGEVIMYLHKMGVVIKVDKELPKGYSFIKTLRNGGWKSVNPNEIGYVATEPWIESHKPEEERRRHRPDNWENPYPYNPEPTPNLSNTAFNAYEVGADAMLEALSNITAPK